MSRAGGEPYPYGARGRRRRARRAAGAAARRRPRRRSSGGASRASSASRLHATVAALVLELVPRGCATASGLAVGRADRRRLPEPAARPTSARPRSRPTASRSSRTGWCRRTTAASRSGRPPWQAILSSSGAAPSTDVVEHPGPDHDPQGPRMCLAHSHAHHRRRRTAWPPSPPTGFEQQCEPRAACRRPTVGDYVLVHAGYAISRASTRTRPRARRLRARLAEMGLSEIEATTGNVRATTRTVVAARCRGRARSEGRMTATTDRRSPELLRRLAAELAEAPPATFMEVCGTHTMAIARFGLRDLLPGGLRLVSGPGCPVCVTAMRDLDKVARAGPSPRGDAGDVRRPGAGCRRRARRSPPSGPPAPTCGWCTRRATPSRSRRRSPAGRSSSPASASRRPRRPSPPPLLEAQARGLPNFSVLSLHKTMPLPLQGAARPGRDRYRRLHPPRARERRHRHGMLRVPGARLRRRRRGRRASRRPTCSRRLLMLAREKEPGDRHPVRSRRCGPRATPWRGSSWSACSSRATPTGAAWGSYPGLGSAIRERVRGLRCRTALRDRPRTSRSSRQGCRCGEVLRGVTRPGGVRPVRTALHAGRPGRGRAWSRARAPARRATATGGIDARS